jgi:hypothetical protein
MLNSSSSRSLVGSSGGSQEHGGARATSGARDYGGTARQSNLEQASRSGYNVGNPRSEEPHGWGGGSGGLAVYNWTNPIDSFGE